MRAQISVETLLVFLLFLVLLGIAYTAASKLGAASQNQINAALSRETYNELSSRLESACLLGQGNVRVVDVKGEAAALSVAAGSGRELEFRAPHFSGAIKSPCTITGVPSGASRSFTIANTGSGLEIS